MFLEKKVGKKLISCGIAMTLLLQAVPFSVSSYTDVDSSDWYYQAVMDMTDLSLFTSVGNNSFAPQSTMSRAMFYTVLCRLNGITPNNTYTTSYTDVPSNQWYTGSVLWAISEGYAVPISSAYFGANTPITRQEMAVAIYEFYKNTGMPLAETVPFLPFADMEKVSPYARDAVTACQQNGIIRGQAGNVFNPLSTASRAEVAQIFSNLTAQMEFHNIPFAGSISVVTPPTDVDDTTDDSSSASQYDGWAYDVDLDFPLGTGESVTSAMVVDLNQRILFENKPNETAPLGTTYDGVDTHLTNYGTGGMYDCIDVTTYRQNKKNNTQANVKLNGDQEYYGYSLHVQDTQIQDEWHEFAEETLKSPWQCTWWVYGRAAQYLDLQYGLDIELFADGETNMGHGGNYYYNLSEHFLSNQTPAPNSIISWSCGTYGHVAYVEAVDENGIWVSAADGGRSWRGITYIERVDSATNPYPLSWFAPESLNGFNHLDFDSDGNALG